MPPLWSPRRMFWIGVLAWVLSLIVQAAIYPALWEVLGRNTWLQTPLIIVLRALSEGGAFLVVGSFLIRATRHALQTKSDPASSLDLDEGHTRNPS